MELHDLPFRLVVQNILSFIELVVSSDDYKMVFGYFKRDPSRHIFFLYSSVSIEMEYQTDCMIPLRAHQVKNMKIGFSQKTAECVSKASHLFASLNSLDITFAGNEVVISHLFKKDGFALLEHLKMFLSSEAVDSTKWHEAERMWKSLRKIEISCRRFSENKFPLFTHEHYFKNLEKLTIQNLIVDSNQIVNLPSIRRLKIHHSDVLIRTSPKIPTILEYFPTTPDQTILFLKNIRNIDELSIICKSSNQRDHYYDFLCEPSFVAKLNTVKLLFLQLLRFSEGKRLIIPKYIQSLFLSFNTDSIFLSEDEYYPALTQLLVAGQDTFNYFKSYSFCRQLVRLSLCSQFRVSDHFFLINTWDSLEVLKLKQLSSLEGQKFNKMPKLKKLLFVDLQSLSNLPIVSGVRNGNSNVLLLENMTLKNCLQFTQESTTQSFSFIKLKHLCIETCKYFRDEYFSVNTFPNLKKVQLADLGKNFTGKGGWSFSNKLTRISISNCPFLTDELFQSDFPELLELTLYQNSDAQSRMLQGRCWGENFKKLRRIELVGNFAKEFSDEIFQGRRMENLEYINVYGCLGICGKGWGEMKYLKEIYLEKCGEGSENFLEKFQHLNKMNL